MSWFKSCEHHWDVVSVAHTLPENVTFERVSGHEAVMQAIRFSENAAKGSTHIAMRCNVCGSFKSETLTGIHKIQIGERPQSPDIPPEAGSPTPK